MRELGLVFQNEWTKLIHRKRLWVTVILGALIVALFFLQAYDQHRNDLRNSPENQLQIMQQQLVQQEQYAKSQPKSDPNMTQEIRGLKLQISDLQRQVALDKASSTANWEPMVQKQIDQQKLAFTEAQASSEKLHIPTNYDQTHLLSLEYNVAHHVKPTSNWMTTPYAMLTNFLDTAARLFLPLLVVILVADMVSGEATSGTIKLLLVRPVSRMKILMGKWLVSLVSSLIVTVGVCAALLIVGFAVFGVTGTLQPVVVGTTYKFIPTSLIDPGGTGMYPIPIFNHVQVLPQWEYVTIGVILIVLAMMVVATIALLCSELLKSAMASTAVALGIVIFGFILTTMNLGQRWITWFFPMYLNLMTNWTGSLSLSLKMNMSLWTGIGVLVAWGTVSLVVALFHFHRKDVLNA